ncbi:hypothetical protein Tco_1463445 [Tanacetum coccineum]
MPVRPIVNNSMVQVADPCYGWDWDCPYIDLETWTKHINVRYHFIREIRESKEIEVVKIATKDNAADAFTKVVLGLKFKYCMKILGVGIN